MSTSQPIDAFISYARSSSSEHARALKEHLETFDRRWDRVRRTQVFLDNQSMSASTSLRRAIESALTRAQWLIVLLSEAAAASPWVDEEISWWLAHKDAETLLLVQVDGTVAWSGNDFTADSTAVPYALRGTLPTEPRWVDLQWFVRVDDPVRDPAFESVVLQLYCPIKGLDRAEAVAARDKNVRTAKRLARGAVVGLTVLALGASTAGVVAVGQARRANEQAEIARSQTVVSASQTLASQAQAHVETNFGLAQLFAIQGVELNDNEQTRSALLDISRATQNLKFWVEAPADVTALHFPSEGGVIVGMADGRVARWVPGEHKLDPLFTMTSEVIVLSADDTGETVAATSRDSTMIWAGQELLTSDASPAAVSHDGTMAVVGQELVSLLSGEVYSAELPWDIYDVVFLADDAGLVVLTAWEMLRYGLGPDGLRFDKSSDLQDLNRNYESPQFARDGSAFASFRGVFPQSRVWSTVGDGEVTGKAPTEGLLPRTVAVSDRGTYIAAPGSRRIVVSRPAPCSTDGVCVPNENELSSTLLGLGDATALTFRGEDLLAAASGTSLAIWEINSLGRDVTQGSSGLPEMSYLDPNIAITADGSAAAVVESSTETLTIIQREPFNVVTVSFPEDAYSVAASIVDNSFVALDYDGEPLYGYAVDGSQVEPSLPVRPGESMSAANGSEVLEIDGNLLRVIDSTGTVLLDAPIPMPMTSHGWLRTVYGISDDGSQLYVVTGANRDNPDQEIQIWAMGAIEGSDDGSTIDLQRLIDNGCALVGRPLTREEWDPTQLGVPEPESRACAN